MDDEKFLPFIIRSKLNRPQIHGVYLHRQQLINELDQSRNRPLTLISAPAGYGKSTLASYWLETSDSPNAWVSLDATDNDLRLFLSYFLTAIQTIFPDSGRQLLDRVNASTLPPLSVLVGNLINDIDRIEQSFILALDDIHLIKDESILELLNQLLHHPPQPMHLMLIGRRDPALPISKLRANRLLTEVRIQELRFNEMEVEKFLTQMLETQVDSSIAAALAEKTEGWVTGLVLAAFSMREQGSLDPALLEPQVDAQSVMEYLFAEVFSKQPSDITQYLMKSAILDRFCGPLCEALCAPGGESSTFKTGGWEFIAWLEKQNLFLIPLDYEKRWFRFHHLFQKLLINQLNRHLSQGDINALRARASKWFAENGLIEEAIKHALAGEDSKTAAQLIAERGFDLLDDMQWPRLQRWLKMLPLEMVDQVPELLALSVYLHQIYSRYPELESCLNKVEALTTTRTVRDDVVGHMNSLRAFQHYFSANAECCLTRIKQAIKEIPKKQRWAREFAFVLKAVAHQTIGDPKAALAACDVSMRESDLYGDASQSHYVSNPCFVHWLEADLISVIQTAGQALRIAGANQSHSATSQSLYFKGVAHYHRNELQEAEELLAAVVKEPYAQYAWNFIHSAFALALLHQARGRQDTANELGESVVYYALQTNHPLMLKFARAFQAELALRQGRFAEVSRWQEQFVTGPLAPMYRFYVPQLTLTRVLLAKDSVNSRKQAADLLKELYDFVVFTNNKRFQIDVLALQALLYDSQGEGPAAIKSLTAALQIAEPGGFIRPFLDLGAPLFDVLKRLHGQKIARDYINEILTAFEQEGEQRINPHAADQPVASAKHPRHPSPPSQPLVEPLTNRELDVLELLARRLSNKEIADKLFISTTTVKGHLQNIYQKLEVGKRREAVEKARKIGIL